MNWPLKIARRYLFAKKSTNAINIISGISVLGIVIGTAALLLTLSVFNGFEDLFLSLFNSFNPDVKITARQGKTFEPTTAQLKDLKALPGVLAVSSTLEEIAFFEYNGSQAFGVLKGVDDAFEDVVRIDTMIAKGEFQLKKEGRNYVVLDPLIRNRLSLDIEDYFTPLHIYMAKQKSSSLGHPFVKRLAYPAGLLASQQDFDNQYVICSMDLARELLNKRVEVSALELKIDPQADPKGAIAKIQQLMGTDFDVKDRYQQDEAFFKLINIEKWMSFALAGLMLLLVACNMIGALWMLVLDKKEDIAILKSMGATDTRVRDLFLYEGILLCSMGLLIGFLLAVGFYILEKSVGIIPIPASFLAEGYPISLRTIDFLIVAITVFAIGGIASLPAAFRAARVPALILEE